MALKQNSKAPQLLGRDLPYNLDAERSVISAVMFNQDSLGSILEIVSSDDFYYESHKLIFRVICQLHEENKNIDFLVLHDHLLSNGLLEKCGGASYLLDLQENLSTVSQLPQHAKIIKDKSTLRQIINSASELIGLSYDPKGKGIGDILDLAEKRIFGIANRLSIKEFSPLSRLLKGTFQKLAEISESKGTVTGVSSGFTKFDSMTSGMQAGDLLILAGRPSMGKTALALNIALSAWKAGAGVGVFSLEMPSEQLVLRMISAESGIEHHKIRTGNISSEEWLELTNTAAVLDEAKIFIDDTPSLSIMELRAKARRLKLKEDIKLLVIDYLQLITTDNTSENRTQEISMISRSLKALAKELDIPVLALSQLSRSLESRMDKRPMLSDLRESGAIEQDADLVFFIYRDVVYNSETASPDVAEVIIGKQRNGPIGSVSVHFDAGIGHFSDLES